MIHLFLPITRCKNEKKQGIMIRNILFIIIILVSKPLVYSQNIDSLQQILKTSIHDTTRVQVLIELSEVLYASNPDTIIPLCEQVLSMIDSKLLIANSQEKLAFLKVKADALNNLGFFYKNHGEISKTLDYYTSSLKIRNEINDKKGIANSLINLGAICYNQGNIPEALDYFLKCLKIQQEINDKVGTAYALNNIALIYSDMTDTRKSLDYSMKSLKIWEEIQNKNGMATSLHNIGAFYDKQGDSLQALDYYNRSLAIQKELGNQQGIASCLNNIGFIYYNFGNTPKALEYYYKSLDILEKINDTRVIAFTLANIAEVLLKEGQIKKALSFAERSLKIAQELKYPTKISKASVILSKIYAKNLNWKGAYEMQVLYKLMSDSINNESNRKASIQKGFKFEYEKKATADSIKATEEKKVFNAQRKQENTKRTALYIGIVLFAAFSLFMYKRYRLTQKQKGIIEQQKELVEKQKKILEEQKQLVDEHSKEISDSINYAGRIQKSLLASNDLLESNLGEHFILFQPRNVVSGDFYWATVLPDGSFLLVTADSTGHGIPGAIMSMLNISCLKETLKEGFSEPADILNNTRKLIIETLKKDGSGEGGKDGMDCSIIRFDLKRKTLTYSAANNPVWIVRKKELLELPFDKMPVGKHDRDNVSFTQHLFELQPDDMVFAITDGLPDQFGGIKGKKFMHKQLKEVLVSNAHMQVAEQKTRLVSTLNNWKGQLEQVDDITVIGIRI